MKLSVLKENLNKGLSTVSHLIQSNNSLEVLGNILIQTSDGLLELQSTNLELAISYKLGAKIEKTGSLSVPARLFSELVSSLPNGKLQLIKSKDNLEIHALHLKSLINGINSNDFPKIPIVKPINQFKISGKKLVEALEFVSSSASLDESRPVLTGVLCSVENSLLTFASTDSYRLSQYKLKNTDSNNVDVIIPIKTVNEVLRIVKSEDIQELEVGVTETEIIFYTKNITLTSQLIDGNYPDYTKIIPKESNTVVEVDKNDLLSNLKISTLFSRENANTVNLKTGKNLLEITAEGSQVGINSSEIPVTINGKEAEININAKYLIDAVNTIKGNKVVISLNDKLDPCLVSADLKNSDNFHIIMPLKS